MGLWEVSFRCRYEFPLIALSLRFPGTPLYAGCLGNRGWVQVPNRDEATLQDIAAAIVRSGGVIEDSRESGDSQVFLIVERWSHELGIHRFFEQNQFRLATPWRYQDGWGYFRMLSFDDLHLSSFFRDVAMKGSVELLRKTKLPLEVPSGSVSVQALFADLTSKQAEALLRAHRARYYASPRRVTRAEIAREIGIGRTTFEEHLRKAENKMMNALIPHLLDFSRTDRPVKVEWRGKVGSIVESSAPRPGHA